MNPTVVVNLDAISFNASEIKKMCAQRGMEVDAVLKGVCGDPTIACAVIDGGITSFMDSRLKNIIRMRKAGITERIGLLRIPMMSELEMMIEYCDWALVSMPEVIRQIEEKCKIEGKDFEILLMTDLGDLREGVLPEQISETAEVIKQCKYVKCIGLGTNLGCFGGVLPSQENMGQLITLATELRTLLGAEKWLISAGGSQVYYDMAWPGPQTIPNGITHIRPGGALLRGMCQGNDIPGLRQDTMCIEAEFVEIAKKPSKPYGNIGVDAFGKVPSFEDRGDRLRAILALGRQDVVIEELEPICNGIEILGGSSDHMIVDIEDMVEKPELGDTEYFAFTRYGAMLQAFTSEFVDRDYIRD